MKFYRLFSFVFVLLLGILESRVFAASAELFVFEPNLQRMVGYGTVNGAEFRWTVNSYAGNVKALWSREGRSPAAFTGSLNAAKLQLIGSDNQPLELSKFLSDQGFSVQIVTLKVESQQPIGVPVAPENPKPAVGGANPPAPTPTIPSKPPTPTTPSKPPTPPTPSKPPEKPEKPDKPEKPEKPKEPEKPRGSDRGFGQSTLMSGS